MGRGSLCLLSMGLSVWLLPLGFCKGLAASQPQGETWERGGVGKGARRPGATPRWRDLPQGSDAVVLGCPSLSQT